MKEDKKMERKRSCSSNNCDRNQIDTASNKLVNDTKNSNATSSITPNMKRNTFSDLTNFNLIPTETLRKLCSNSIPPSEAQSLLCKSRVRANPDPSKPYLLSHSDSRSATSIGSSNFNSAPNAQPQNATSPPKNPSFTGENGDEMVRYSRRKDSENLKGQRKIAISPNTSINLEKKKNLEEAISVPLGSGSFEKAKDKRKGVTEPSDSTPTANPRDKGNAIAEPIDSTPVGNLRVKEKETPLPFRSSDVENRWDKGKAVYVPSTSTLVEKTKYYERKVIPHEELKGKQKSFLVPMNSLPLKKPKDKRKADDRVLSCPPLSRTRKIGNEVNEARDINPSRSWTDPHPRTKKKKGSRQNSAPEYSYPEEYLKQQKAYFDEVDAFELPVVEVSYYESG